MRKLALALLGCTMLGTSLTGAAAAELRREVTVAAAQVRLGDLFDGLDAATADQVATAAPAPAKALRLEAHELARLAEANGLDWRPAAGDRATVTRAAHKVARPEIEAALAKALAASGAPAGLQVTLDNQSLALAVATDVAPTVGVENLSFDAARNRVTAELVVPAEGPAALRQNVGARAVAVIEVPVLNRRVAPGEVIAEGDVEWITLPRDRAGANLLTDASALVGQTVRRGLPAFQPVRGGDVRTPVVVARGAMVTILLQTPSMTLSAQGKALSEGGQDETIRVVNTASNRVVEARVAGPDLVLVAAPGSPRPAARTQTASN
ncbi:MAG TPA: flagellar basal body P-ring formation chaperone FlgA [Azospirillaceae bacterium]|nr:flagellar basal body P-ring formation chaperone FlgA [Azospirillaceae bacterium]